MAKALTVVQLVAAGETVHQACEKAFVTVAAFRAAVKREPLLQPMLEEAMEIRNSIMNDMLVNIDKHVPDAKMASVISKNIQWVLERNDPQKFGARVTLEGGNEASKLLALALTESIKRIPMPVEIRPTFTDVSFETVDRKAPPTLGLLAAQDGGDTLKGGTPPPAATQKPVTLDELKALGLV